MDLAAYYKRIGLPADSQFDVSFQTLVKLHAAQAFHIPFENFDVHLKGDVSLDKQAIFDKIVHQGRGGWCYEVNGLFYDVLETLGFHVHYLVSRPMLGYSEVRPKTHMILMIEIGDQKYIADLGFTGMSLVAAVPLLEDFEFEQFSQVYRFQYADNGDFLLETKLEGEWVTLFSFDLQEQQYIDFNLANFFNSQSTQSVCTNKVIAATYRANGRIRLLDNVVKIRLVDDCRDVALQTEEAFGKALQEYFGLDLSSMDIAKLYSSAIH